MIDKSAYNISQDFEIVPHKKGRVYPILVEEWVFIKSKITALKIEINLFHTLGSIFIGAALSFLATNMATVFSNATTETWCWAGFIVSAVVGILSFLFGESRRKTHNAIPIDVVNYMDLIESKYEQQTD